MENAKLCIRSIKAVDGRKRRCFTTMAWYIYGSMHEIVVLIASTSSEGSGESTQMRRLARAFAALMHKVWM